MNPNHSRNVTFSFIVPLCDEQKVLERFYGRLVAVAKDLAEPYEIIFIDDGSRDGTDEILSRLHDADERVKVVEFSRNFGRQAALTAGYDFATGQAVISLNADSEHLEELVPQMISRWREGFEVVYGVRKETDGGMSLRRRVARLVPCPRRSAGADGPTDWREFLLVDRKAVDAVRSACGQGWSLADLLGWIGFRQSGVTYVAGKRPAARSDRSLKQRDRIAAAGAFGFPAGLLRLVPRVGVVFIAAALIYAVLSLLLWPFGLLAGGWTHVAAVIIALFGLQLLLLGLLGEHIGRLLEQAGAPQLYIVRQTLGLHEGGAERRASAESAEQPPSGITVFT